MSQISQIMDSVRVGVPPDPIDLEIEHIEEISANFAAQNGISLASLFSGECWPRDKVALSNARRSAIASLLFGHNQRPQHLVKMFGVSADFVNSILLSGGDEFRRFPARGPARLGVVADQIIHKSYLEMLERNR